GLLGLAAVTDPPRGLLLAPGLHGAERGADDDGAEAVDPPQLGLPAHDRLQLAVPPLHAEAVDGVLGDDDEQGRVDGVDAFAEDGALPAALPAPRPVLAGAAQEGAGVLEVVGRGDAAERLAGRQRLAVAGVDVADLALRDG